MSEQQNKGLLGLNIKKATIVIMTIILTSCGGGGGGGGNSSVPPVSIDPGSGWVAGQYDDWRLNTVRNVCANPRTTGGYNDSSGSVTDENFWIRSYSNDTYLWYSELPDVDPGTVNNTEDYFELMITDGLSASGNSKDQFHYSQNTEEYNQYYAGVSAGYGVRFFIISSSPPRKIIVGYNEPNSPASEANLSRGAEIISIDGESIEDSDNVDALNAGLFPVALGETHTFVVRDLNATEDRTFTMVSAETTSVPVKNITTFDVAGAKVGYFTFNSHIKPAETQLINAISQLKASNIDELIVDLRYNGGGYLTIAAELGYMVAGVMSEGRVFDELTFNDKYTERDPINNNIIDPSRFESTAAGFDAPNNPTPAGTALPALGLGRVFVLSSGGTASASEAFINGLRGVDVEVILIGEATRGKPYGWYALDNCGTTYSTIQFKGSNEKGFGDYSDGFFPVASADLSSAAITGCEVADDLSHALGDASEGRLAAALSFIETGACPSSAAFGFTAKSPGIPHPLSAVSGRLIQPELGTVVR
ncbi:MAG: carboxyl-terminal processing protease [Porticoccaceae bacterium]|jgi:carboxyl-terminal processing protease